MFLYFFFQQNKKTFYIICHAGFQCIVTAQNNNTKTFSGKAYACTVKTFIKRKEVLVSGFVASHFHDDGDSRDRGKNPSYEIMRGDVFRAKDGTDLEYWGTFITDNKAYLTAR